MKKNIAAAIAALSLAIASPLSASAAVGTLPVGDRLFTLECSSGSDGVNDSQLYQINSVSGEITAIGTGQSTDTGPCGSNVSYDQTTDTYWTFDWSDVDPDTVGTQYGLLKINIETGEITSGPATNLDGNFGWSDNYSIAIDAHGDAYAIGGNYVYSINLETGDVSVVWQTDINSNEGGGQPYGSAFNPADGLLYVQYDSTREMWALDLDSETYTLVEEFPSGDEWYGPFGFDSDGNVWQQNNYDFFTYSLADTESLSERVPVTLDSDITWTGSLFVARGASSGSSILAETGFDTTPWLAVSALTLTAGAVAVRRRARN